MRCKDRKRVTEDRVRQRDEHCTLHAQQDRIKAISQCLTFLQALIRLLQITGLHQQRVPLAQYHYSAVLCRIPLTPFNLQLGLLVTKSQFRVSHITNEEIRQLCQLQIYLVARSQCEEKALCNCKYNFKAQRQTT